MNIKVNPHTITIERTEDINSGEYNITTCKFDFSEEYADLTKEAVFSTCDSTYKVAILNNECTIPYEVLETRGQVLLGVYGYEITGEEGHEELELRYSPTPRYFNVKEGSYREGNDPDLPKPSEWERVLALINEAITETNNLNLVADKEGNITKITITKKDGTSYDVDVLDGVSLEDIEINDRNLLVTYGGETDNLGQVVPNIQIGSTTTGNPGTNARVVNVGTDLNPILEFTIPQGEPGAIKVQIVNELPQTGSGDTIYLVPLEEPETQENRYAEYVWINGAWELLGKIGVQVDLTDYYTKTETNNLLSGKQNTLTAGTYITITNDVIDVKDVVRTNGNDYIYGNKYFDNFPTTNSEKTPDSNSQLVPKKYVDDQVGTKLDTSKVKTSQSTTSGDVYDVTYINSLIGDINTALDTINGEVI